MLTKRQLEDAAECLARFHERTCGQCSCNKFRYIEEGHYSSLEELAEVKKLLKESEAEEG
mgnify:CR=1 FL=1